MVRPVRTAVRSLRFELLVSLAVVLLMAVLSLSFLNEFLDQRRHQGREQTRIEAYAEGLANLCAREFRGPQSFDRVDLQNELQEQLASQFGLLSLQIYRVGDDGPQELLTAGNFERLDTPLSTPERVTTRREDASGVFVVDAPLPVRSGDLEPPVLRVIAQPSPFMGDQSWRDTTIVAAGVVAVLLLFGGALIELSVSRPLRAVRDGAARVAEGELDVTVPTDGPLELAELADDFNRMTSSLREQVHTVAKQAEQLQRTEQLAAIGRLAAGVAHEVGNPLAAIHGYAEFLLDPRSELDPNHRELLERMKSQTERIQGIVAQLLDYARERALDLQRGDVRDAVREVTELVRGDPRTRDVDLTVSQGAPAMARFDHDVLVQVLLNLVINAVHAAHDGPGVARVHVRVAPPSASRVWIEVQDNGPGVDEQVRARIFEPFFTTRAAGQGSGLGLAISQGLIERMEGELICLPAKARAPLRDAERHGAVFRIVLAQGDDSAPTGPTDADSDAHPDP